MRCIEKVICKPAAGGFPVTSRVCDRGVIFSVCVYCDFYNFQKDWKCLEREREEWISKAGEGGRGEGAAEYWW